jgi:tyrosine-protein phosphatase YwqE
LNIFSNLFKKKENIALLNDFGIVGIDMHSHLIPGIDDGAKTMADSLAMIASPHIMMDHYRNTREGILSGLEQLQQAIVPTGMNVKVHAAAEYYLDSDFLHKIEHEPLLTLGKKYLLFEISYLNAPDNLNDAIFLMQANGYKPVLAHPERYPFWYHSFKKYQDLKDKGVLFQLNINSLTGYYSPVTQKMAEKLIDAEMIDFLGTDCHHVGHLELMKQALKNPRLSRLLASGKLRNRELID